MKKIGLLLMVATLIAFISCKDEKKKAAQEEEKVEETIATEKKVEEKTVQKTVSFKLEPKSDSKAKGKVYIQESNGTVTLEVKIAGLAPGTHAIHIHEKADCSSTDGKSSGGHWNPTFKPHGSWGSEEGYHKGDIGNFEVGEGGVGKISFETSEWCIGCGDQEKDILGKAIIVHQGADDFESQPSGAAGARISCGGIIQ